MSPCSTCKERHSVLSLLEVERLKRDLKDLARGRSRTERNCTFIATFLVFQSCIVRLKKEYKKFCFGIISCERDRSNLCYAKSR